MDPGIADVSDTALWIAGDRGRELARKMTGAEQFEWMTVVRTVVIDRYLQEAIARGVDTVVNLGAGLDTRPYRMPLPASLSWVEIDMPKLIALKEDRLAGETPRCGAVADLVPPDPGAADAPRTGGFARDGRLRATRARLKPQRLHTTLGASVDK